MDANQQPSAMWPRTAPTRPDAPVGADAPQVLRSVNDTQIVAYRGRFFGVPNYLGAVDQLDLSRDDNLPSGVLAADSEAALEAEIDYVARWANARGQFDAQEAQRKGGSQFRAGSMLGEPEISVLEGGYTLIKGRDGMFAVPTHIVRQIGKGSGELRVLSVVSEGAQTEVLGPVNGYMVFTLDLLFYAIPQVVIQAAARDPRLKGIPLHEQPGTLTADSYPELLEKIGWRRERRLRSSGPSAARGPGDNSSGGVPRKVRSLNGYSIIAYEGWYYGIPESLGPVDLTQVDALSLPGIIADVAQVGVESAILDRAARKPA